MSICPRHSFSADFDPLDLSDPFPLLAEARQSASVFYSPAIGYWVITRYDDIKAIFRDHETYTAANTITPIVPFPAAVKQMLEDGNYSPEPVLSNNVPPSHTRIRTLVNRLFTPRRMKSFAPAIGEIAERGVSRISDRAPLDIVAELTFEYPAYVLFHVLGVPETDVPQVKAWAGNRIKLYYGRPTAAEQIAMTKNLVPFWRYVVDLVSEKARHPQDDLTSDLIHLRNGDDSVLTLNEIASCMITLLVAGHETTTAQINNALLHLLSQREHWQALCDAPETIPQTLEEMMRYDPSVCTWATPGSQNEHDQRRRDPGRVQPAADAQLGQSGRGCLPRSRWDSNGSQKPQGPTRLRLRDSLLRRRAAGSAGDADPVGKAEP